METAPPVSLRKKHWTALCAHQKICLEFKTVVGKDRLQELYAALDAHTTRLMDIFKAKTSNFGEQLANLLLQMQSLDPTRDPQKRTVALGWLPYLLGDNPTEFFKSSFETDESFPQIAGSLGSCA